jgi:putative toxin-antitoxin system antitoxin component (TIGR02293 family)
VRSQSSITRPIVEGELQNRPFVDRLVLSRGAGPRLMPRPMHFANSLGLGAGGENHIARVGHVADNDSHMAKQSRRRSMPPHKIRAPKGSGKTSHFVRIAKEELAPPSTREAVDPAGQSYVTLLGLHSTRMPDIVQTVQKGIPFAAFERFVANTAISSVDAAMLVSIPVRTLSRRKQEGRLQPGESDRLLRATRVLGRAIGLFEGDRDEARQWLGRPQRALGGATPLELASTDVGALAVERLIEQLEQGVFV